MNEKEKYRIKFFNSQAPNGYNLTSGGEGNDAAVSYATRCRLSRVHMGREGGMLNKHQTEESKQKMRKPCIEERRQMLIGRHPSEKTLQKMKVTHNTPDSIEKSRVSHLGKYPSNKTRKKMRASQKLRRFKEKKDRLAVLL